MAGREQAVECTQRRQSSAQAGEFSEGNLCGQVADESVLREGASAETAESCIEAAAAGSVSGGDLCGSVVGARVQMDAKLDIRGERRQDGGDQRSDIVGRGETDGIGERNL